MDTFTINQLPVELQALITWQDVTEGQIIFRDGDAAELLFFLESGQVKLLQYTEAGKTIEHYGVEADEFFAEIVLFLEDYACSAIATQPSRIAAIPKVHFLTELRQNPQLATVLMSQMAQRLHFTKIFLELRSIRSARERVIRYLQIMIPLVGDPQQSRLDLDRPFKSIAGDLGLSPEVLSRTLRQLQEDGVIERVDRSITLLL
jgi:CRP/FNR family transcriptional regulator, dissimilatory nitrate respiration regulator